jgi:hypothetical protein
MTPAQCSLLKMIYRHDRVIRSNRPADPCTPALSEQDEPKPPTAALAILPAKLAAPDEAVTITVNRSPDARVIRPLQGHVSCGGLDCQGTHEETLVRKKANQLIATGRMPSMANSPSLSTGESNDEPIELERCTLLDAVILCS